MTYESPIRIVAALIVDDRGRILLVRKQGTPYFMQPGGKVEHNETKIKTLQREVLEELGCEIITESARYKGHFTAIAANEPGQSVEADLFELQIVGQARAQSEIAEIIWIAPEDTGQIKLAPLTEHHVLPLVSGK